MRMSCWTRSVLFVDLDLDLSSTLGNIRPIPRLDLDLSSTLGNIGPGPRPFVNLW